MGMVVSMDKGAKNDVHPTDKKTIAQRLASFALHDNYGFTNAATITKPIHVEYKNGFKVSEKKVNRFKNDSLKEGSWILFHPNRRIYKDCFYLCKYNIRQT